MRHISPILDGFRLEQPCQSHGASLCCPAVEIATGEHFVVKMIALPASAVHMDALLMAGAFADRPAANAYFKEQARGILNEAKSLRHLATLGGFSDFDSVQVVPAEQENGFEVYLLSPQRTSLQQILQRRDVTELEVVNMALDLCAALTTCRHAGFFYTNLKPGNVFCVGQHYRIGDLGLMPMSAVGHSRLSDQYISPYTPPELRSGDRPLNGTADVYALGLILYQAYNGGQLPGEDAVVGKLLAPPRYADYEMAEIILRACAPDPAIRWNDPEQMGYAISRYLQRNGMHDRPIIAPALNQIVYRPSAPVEDFLPEIEDDTDFQEPTPPAPSAPSAPRRRPRRKNTVSRSRRLLIVGLLALVLLAEILIGIWLLRRSKGIQIDYLQLSPASGNLTLTLGHQGHAPDGWIITYSADGEREKTVYFSGDTVDIPDLTPGNSYTFVLSAQDGQRLTGQTQITYTPQ